jgi:hypothetical protein
VSHDPTETFARVCHDADRDGFLDATLHRQDVAAGDAPEGWLLDDPAVRGTVAMHPQVAAELRLLTGVEVSCLPATQRPSKQNLPRFRQVAGAAYMTPKGR